MPQLFNELLDDPLAWEFQQDFSGGENSFHRSTLIDPNQCQQLLNVLVRDNYEARTRPGADAIPAPSTVPISGTTACRSLRYFDTPTYSQLIASLTISGAFGIAKYEAGAWTNLTASLNAAFTPSADSNVAMAQGIDKMLISCGSGQAQVYTGAAFVNAGNSTSDCPGDATILMWHTARMFASGRAAAPDTVYVSNLLNFVAGQWNWTTRSFRVGVGDGDPILAMASMQNFTMCVFKRNSVWLINTNPDNDANFAAPVQGFVAAEVGNIGYGIGCVGRDAWCNYGNDVLFMAQDGIRSIERMQSASGQWQLSAPISQPIQNIIARINKAAWSGIVAKKHEELALFFVPVDGSTTNNAVIVWNGRLGKWLGLWTGWTGLCVEITRFLGVPELTFGDNTGYVNVWKDRESDTEDDTYQDNAVGYPTKVWSKSWLFAEPIATKTGDTTKIKFSAGNTTLNVSWMADNAVVKNWVGDFEPEGDILGEGIMPFLLASTSPVTITENIRGLSEFNEAFVKIESTTGWFWLKSIAACAFVNPLDEGGEES
jgi:hypothetical protein